MRTLGDLLKKTFSPTVAIKVEDLGNSKLAKAVLLKIYESERKKESNVLLDVDKGVIYLKEKEKNDLHS